MGETTSTGRENLDLVDCQGPSDPVDTLTVRSDRDAFETSATSVSDTEPGDALRLAMAQFGIPHGATARQTRLRWALASLMLAVGALIVPGIDHRVAIAIVPFSPTPGKLAKLITPGPGVPGFGDKLGVAKPIV